MEKESHQKHGKRMSITDMDKLLDERKYSRKALPKIPHVTWTAFEKFADDECCGDWGMAFDRIVRESLIEPEWLAHTMSNSDEIERLSNELVELRNSLESSKPVEEDVDLGVNAAGEKFNMM